MIQPSRGFKMSSASPTSEFTAALRAPTSASALSFLLRLADIWAREDPSPTR